MKRRLRVIKLGGSLLSRSNWQQDFAAWHEESHARSRAGKSSGSRSIQATNHNALPDSAARTEPRPPDAAMDVLIVGGGKPVNALRKLAGRVARDESTAHWIAIEFMSANTRLVANRLNCPIVETYDSPGPFQLLDPALLLQSGKVRLEESWKVTSDSIAAAVAVEYGADELILLKSKPPPSDDVEELARIGYVDECFPTASTGIRQISVVALKATQPD